MGINSQIRINAIKGIDLSHNYWYELQFHTEGSFFLKDQPSHLYYEAFRDPKHERGTIPPKHANGQADYSDATTEIFEGDDFQSRLYLAMVQLWNVNNKSDDDLVFENDDGEPVLWKDCKNFKPSDLGICSYFGGKFKGSLATAGRNGTTYPKPPKSM